MKFGINNPAWLQAACNAPTGNFYIISRESNNQLSFAEGTRLGDYPENFEYRVNSQEDWVQVTQGAVIEINSGDIVYLRNYNRISVPGSSSKLFAITGHFDAGGDLMNLINPEYSTLDTRTLSEAFSGLPIVSAKNVEIPKEITANLCKFMFNGCTSLVEAPTLPATTALWGCYEGMFNGCTSLVEAPALPATVLAEECYKDMFQGCTSLVEAPILPATFLPNNSYNGIFYGCTNLKKVVCLATELQSESATDYWLGNVGENGVFVKSPGMNDWPTGDTGIPEGWTVQDYAG